jgi:hypothetical protein
LCVGIEVVSGLGVAHHLTLAMLLAYLCVVIYGIIGIFADREMPQQMPLAIAESLVGVALSLLTLHIIVKNNKTPESGCFSGIQTFWCWQSISSFFVLHCKQWQGYFGDFFKKVSKST